MNYNSREVTLNEISIGKGSYGISASAVEYSPEKYTYLRITDITDDGTLKKESLMSVDDINAYKYLLEPNDIVFARTGNSTGRSYFYDGSDGELVYAGFLIKFSLDSEKVNPKFMKYYTLSNEYKNWVSSFSTGSTRGNINAKTYGEMKINLPNKKQQDLIVNVLSSIDRKIELNNEMNKTLEEVAQALFKRWFIDFEFPNEDGIAYKSSGGEMVESELGMIPKGWKVAELDEIVSLIIDHRGKTPKKLGSEWAINGYKAISAKNIKNGCIVNEVSIKYVDEELYNKWMKDKLKFGDILMTSEAPVGELYYITYDIDYCLSQRLYGIRANEEIMRTGILYYFMKSPTVMGQILNRATGTTVVGIRQSELRKIKLVIPEKTLQDKMENIINTIVNKIGNINEENKNFTELRDSLLPKLISGKIRVEDIEANL